MMAARRRRAGRRGAPSAELAEDELARHWSLSPEDLIEIRRCRGADHRRRFALQLCMLRAHGRFFDDYRQAPLRIVNHLSRQLDLPPVLLLDRPRRDPTERTQAQRIRRYLGIRSFDGAAEADLRDWVRQGAVEGRSVAELLGRAEDRLRTWQVMVPAVSTLERIVASEVAQGTTDLFAVIAQRLPASLRDAIGLLLEVPGGDARSSLFRLKDHAKSAKAATIKGDLVRLGLIDELLLGGGVGLDDVDPRVVRQLGELGRRYDSGDLRRFASPKRDALVACYLVEARKSLLDRVVELHDQFMITMSRRARLAAEAQLRVWRRRARDGLERVLGAIETLNAARPDETVAAFRDRIGASAMAAAVTACRTFARLEDRGYLDAMLARYGTLRQYLPNFAALPLQAAAGSEPLLAAVRVLRALDQGTRGAVETTDPCGFVPAAWRPFLIENGRVDRRIWEIALALALRDALRAGNLFLAESREHVSFWDLIHSDRRWREQRAQAYAGLGLPLDPTTFLVGLTTALDDAARTAARGLPHNRFAAIINGRLKLKVADNQRGQQRPIRAATT